MRYTAACPVCAPFNLQFTHTHTYTKKTHLFLQYAPWLLDWDRARNSQSLLLIYRLSAQECRATPLPMINNKRHLCFHVMYNYNPSQGEWLFWSMRQRSCSTSALACFISRPHCSDQLHFRVRAAIRVSAQVSSKDIALSISRQRGGGCSSPGHCRASASLQSESQGSEVGGQACFTPVMMNWALLDFIA